MPRKQCNYTEDFKKTIVALKQNGTSVSELANSYELSRSTIFKWVSDHNNSGSFKAKDNRTKEADSLFQELFPICRSISGDGVRETFKKLQKIATFDIHEIKSGTICYDWQVPKEWNITDAYIQDNTGRKIVQKRVDRPQTITIRLLKKMKYDLMH